MTGNGKRAITLLGMLGITAAALWLLTKDGDNGMITECAKNFDGMKEHEELGEDEYKENIQPRWGIERPDGLLLIGGIDDLSWAKICRDDDDPEGIFRGEIIDWGMHYIGRFRYEHPEGRPLPKNIFREYRMSSLSGHEIIFRQDSPPPVDYFSLIAIDPDGYRKPIASD